MRRLLCYGFLFLCCAWGVTAWGATPPIKASANGRYLVDANGVPWILVGDSAHHIINDLSAANIPTYLQNRQTQGFNTVNIFAMCAHGNCPSNGAAVDGTLPFTSGNSVSTYDLSTPNNSYWAEVDSVVTQAAALGLVVLMDPIPTASPDFLQTMQNNGATKVFNFGAYIGNRYKNNTNIIWFVGNDLQTYSSSSTDMNLLSQFMAGLHSTDPNHLIFPQLTFNRSYSNQAIGLNAAYDANITGDFTYDYYETYNYTLAAYNSSPTLPVVFSEGNYENVNKTGQLSGNATPFILRLQMYWTMTSGGAGHVWGNEAVNHFDTTTGSGSPAYPAALNTTGTAQVALLTNLFNAYPWWNLVPDQTHQVVTAGYGTANPNNLNLFNGTYATTAWITDGSLAITYCPAAVTLTVNMAKFSGLVTARWYDPTNGSYQFVTGGPFTNTGAKAFATPGNNSEGSKDWVLVLSTSTATAPAPPTNLKAIVQ